MVSHRHTTDLSSRLFLLALTEKRSEGIGCNGGCSLPLFSIPYVLMRMLTIKKRFQFRVFRSIPTWWLGVLEFDVIRA